jgi:hypothetical protein
VVDDEVVDDEVTVASLQEVAPWIERSNDARM